jgi:hypothetical protein
MIIESGVSLLLPTSVIDPEHFLLVFMRRTTALDRANHHDDRNVAITVALREEK